MESIILPPYLPLNARGTLVYLNSDPIGRTMNPIEYMNKVRESRRSGMLTVLRPFLYF